MLKIIASQMSIAFLTLAMISSESCEDKPATPPPCTKTVKAPAGSIVWYTDSNNVTQFVTAGDDGKAQIPCDSVGDQ